MTNINLPELIGEIYDCVNDQAQWEGVFHSLHRAFNCSMTQPKSQGDSASNVTLTRPIGCDQSAFEEYVDKWLPIDLLPGAVFTEITRRGSFTQPLWQTALFEDNRYLKSVVYNEYFIPNGQNFWLCLPWWQTTTNGAIGLWRDVADFNKEERKAASILSPHLMRAKRLGDELVRSRAFLSGQSSAHPLFMIDENFTLLEYNRQAERLLNQQQIVTIHRSSLKIIDKSVHQQVQLTLKTKPTTSAEIRYAHSGNICIIPVIVGAPSRRELFSRHYYLEIIPPKDDMGGVNPIVVSSLTKAEREVTSLLAQGLSVREISEHRQSTLSTIRWHIRQIYDKLGVTNQRELLLKVLG